MKKQHLYAGLFALGCLGAAKPAQAVTCSQAFVFATGQTLTATNLNANPANEISCINNIDHTNLGSAGIYASQVIPATAPQAAFGGSLTYTFPAGISAVGAIVAGSATAPAFNPGDLVASQTASIGVLRLGGSSSTGIVDYGASNAGAITLGNPTFVYGSLKAETLSGTAPTTSSGDLSGTRSTTTGALVLGGSASSGTLDYGVTAVGVLTSSVPFAATAITAIGAITAGTGTATSPAIAPGYLTSTTGTSKGVLDLGSSTGNGTLDYGTSHAGNFTLTTSGANGGLYFGYAPGGGTPASLNDYEVGTWTPTDASGASLVFTGVTGSYVKIGRLVFVQAQLSYPVTASAANASLTPLFAASGINQLVSMGVIGGATVDLMSISSGTFFPVALPAYTNVTNATLSGKTIIFSGTYESSS
jgi:hypothetical protein